ncbi:MAG: MBL fold metallo-hydrolase [Hadesarchaea archaeon]|nr:MAG: MBL fold metallo-hydrolase [Hadesarchaea archaeon]
MLEELAPGIYFVEGENRGRYPFSNSLLLKGRNLTALIDTGIGPERARELAKEEKVDLLLVSHGHEDHFCQNRLFEGAKVLCHREDAPAVRSVKRLEALYGCPNEEIGNGMMEFLIGMFDLGDSRVDVELEGGEVLDLGGLEVEVLHTPGHSSGHCCFWIPSERLLFLADIDLTSFGPWYGCVDSDIDQFLSSLKRVKELPVEVAVTSHKGVVRGREEIREKLEEYGKKIEEREKRLLAFLEEERTLKEIVDAALIYGRFPEPQVFYRLFERMMVEKHLRRMEERGEVVRTERGFRRA